MKKQLLVLVLLCIGILFGCGIDETDNTVKESILDGNPSYEIIFDKGITISEAEAYIESGRFAEDRNINYPNYSVWLKIEGMKGIGVTFFKDYEFRFWMPSLEEFNH